MSTPLHKSRLVLVVEKTGDWKAGFPELPVVTARDYLGNAEYSRRGIKVINLCRRFGYLETGYYCSLLAEARRQRMLPGVRTLSDLTRKVLYRLDAESLDRNLQRYLRHHDSAELSLRVYFGKAADPALNDLARQLFEAFPCPLLEVEFRLQGEWKLQKLRALGLHQLHRDEHEVFSESLLAYIGKRWRSQRQKESTRYDLAILVNPDDPLPPSDEKALKRFERIGKDMGIAVERIGRKDISRLAEFDALFIRDTTRINHYTYRFSRQAESEGLVVIDDPQSILRCTNKVYLAELLQQHRIPHPKTRIVQQGQLDETEKAVGYPIVLKIPDGSFSRGVYKAANRRELEEVTAKLFRESDLILAQEYLYTEYDWRIGILDGEALFACQYFMSKNHWQIVDHKTGGGFSEGRFRTMPIEEAPENVVALALRSTRLIGNGLYGVDIKSNADGGAYVIEINDNPNLEAGVEDRCLGDQLYRIILGSFVRRIDARRRA